MSGLPQALFLAGLVAMIVIRFPHVRRSMRVAVARSDESVLDRALIVLVSFGIALPLLWVATPLLAFADYAPRVETLAAGAISMTLGLWLLFRSHADLGASWSNTLELRTGHRLVMSGVYRRLRHPMYSGLLLHGLGQALLIPNWVAGPAFVGFLGVLIATRLGAEERMMLRSFGAQYRDYAERTERLVPGVY